MPGFIVLLTAIGIRSTGRGRIPLFSPLIMTYPLVPWFFICWGLKEFTSIDENLLGAFFSLLCFIAFCVIGAKVEFMLAALLGILSVAVIVVGFTIELTGAYDISAKIHDFIVAYGPGFPVRYILWLIVPLGILNVALMISGYVASMLVTLDNFRPGSINVASEIDRTRNTFHVWREWDNWIWFGASALFLLPDDAGARLDLRAELQQKSILDFPVVPWGGSINSAMQESRDRRLHQRT
jgi:hypothetical protein